MFLPPIRISFPLLPGFSFGENPASYPLGDSHVSYMVLGNRSYPKRGDPSEYTTISRNLIVLFRALAFYIDLQALPGFWKNIAEAWKVTDVDNTRSIVNFYAERHLDWTKDPRMNIKNMSQRDRLLVHLVRYWCEHRGKTIRRSRPDDLRLFRDMGIEWSVLRDHRRRALFSEMRCASLRKLALNLPTLTISHSFSLQPDNTPDQRVGQTQEFSGTWQSRTDPPMESKSSQSFERGYTEQRDPRHRSRSFSVPRGAQSLGASSSETQRSQPPSGVVNVASQPSESSQIMASGHQQQHQGYIASQPFQVNPSQLRISQSLDSSFPQSQELPLIAKSVTPAKDTKDTTPKPRANKTQPKKQLPLSPKRIEKKPTSSPSPSTGSDGDVDSEESESMSESETEASSVYQDTGSGAEPGVIQRFKRDHIPRKMTRSLTSSPSGNSSSSEDSSDSDSASDSDSSNDSSNSSGSGSIGSTSSNTNEGSSASDSDSSDDDSDGSEDESDSEPELPKPLTPKKLVKKPAKTPVETSTRGKKKARSSNSTKGEEDSIKSEPESDSGIASVPMASIPAKDQEPPTSAQRHSIPPTKRKGQPKPEIRSAKRRREEDEVEKQTATGRPATKKRATSQQQSSPSEKTKSSKARGRNKRQSVEASYGEESAKAKARRYTQKESSPRLEQTFEDSPPIESEHKRSIDMLIQRINALEEKSMRQDKKIMKQDEKIMKQDKKIMRQDEKIIRQDEKIIKQDEKMMK